MKQCTCFALKAINCICADREDENSFAHWFYGAPHRIKYLRDHPVFLAAQEAWDAAKKQEAEKQEPVAWFESDGKGNIEWHHDSAASDDPSWLDNPMPVYTHPQPKRERNVCERCGKRLFDGIHTCTPPAEQPKREWVGLTDEEIDELAHTMVKGNKSVNWLAQTMEAALRSKNT